MNDLLDRALAKPLHAHLKAMPAVVVTGARQTGKSTLAQAFAPGARRFLCTPATPSSGWRRMCSPRRGGG